MVRTSLESASCWLKADNETDRLLSLLFDRLAELVAEVEFSKEPPLGNIVAFPIGKAQLSLRSSAECLL
jgi:hypothetical protein